MFLYLLMSVIDEVVLYIFYILYFNPIDGLEACFQIVYLSVCDA